MLGRCSALLLALAGCRLTSRYVDYRPSPDAPVTQKTAEPPDAREVELALPEPGVTRAAALPSGWPVWLSRHADGGVTVVSAVTAWRFRPAQPVPATLVEWAEAPHRFVANGVVYDERGRALGYETVRICMDECTRIEDLDPHLTDLDTFVGVVDAGRGTVRLGPLAPGAPREVAKAWVDLGEPSPARALPPSIPLGELIEAADRTYALVEASIYLSTAQEPRLCATRFGHRGCGTACELGALPLGGIPPLPAARVYPGDRLRHWHGAYDGTYLVRRSGTSLFLPVAVHPTGVCGGEAD